MTDINFGARWLQFRSKWKCKAIPKWPKLKLDDGSG